jgi:hypothetical protein
VTLLAYPRLADSQALIVRQQLRELADRNEDLSPLVGFEHPAAQPVPTGAVVADRDRLKAVRERVMAALETDFSLARPVPRDAVALFDRTLGRALHDALAILPADAAHKSTWNFLAAVVFPDVVWARFPDLHEDRFLGTDRNALRRPWFRHEVLGDLMDTAERPLGEDELVGLLERTALARNRRLARTLAAALMTYRGTEARSQVARDVYKRATHFTGPLLLDVLDEDELTRLVDSLFTGVPWPALALVEESEFDQAKHRTEFGFGQVTVGSVDQRSSGDLVREFHVAMEGLFSRTLAETGYKATKFLSMVQDLGGIETARRLVGSPNPSEGFSVLWEHGRLDLTAEALVLDPRFQGLFGDELCDRAKMRLNDYGFASSE